MSSTREIVTLQFGHYANFVGTHFWNIQTTTLNTLNDTYASADESKEINYDVIFREGKTLSNEKTYTPRAIFYDLKNSLNTLKSGGTLYDLKSSNNDVRWVTDAALHVLSTARKNEFIISKENETNSENIEFNSRNYKNYSDEKDVDENDKSKSKTPANNSDKIKRRFKLDNEVRVWSDFLKPHLHPKTIEIIDAESHENADAFDLFCLGSEAYTSKKYEIEDRIHFFTEECDNLQGFHIFADAYNAFSGLASSVSDDYLFDEFSNKGFLIVNTFPKHAKRDFPTSVKSIINTFLCYESLLSSSSSLAILPLSTDTSMLYKNTASVDFPYLNYNSDLPYHSSAILAVALDQLSLKYRTYVTESSLKNYLTSLTFNTHRLISFCLSLPFSLENNVSLFHLFNPSIDKKNDSSDQFSSIFKHLTPGLTQQSQISAQHVMFSGLPDQLFYGSKVDSSKMARYSSRYDLLNEYVVKSFNCNTNLIEIFKNPIHIDEPFPHIFSPMLNQDGYPTAGNVNEDGYVNSAPVATALQNNSATVGHLEEIVTTIEKLPFHKLRPLIGTLEADDMKDKLENMKRFQQYYFESNSSVFS